MSWLSRLGERLARRADPVSLEEFGYLLANRERNQAHAGVSVSEDRAMGITTWYSGVLYLSTAVAFLPMKAYRRVGQEREPRPLPLWLDRPDTSMTRGMLLEQWIVSLLNRGNAYNFKVRDGVGRVVGMRFIHNDRLDVEQNTATGEKRYRVRSAPGAPVAAEWFSDSEIFHIVGPGSDGVVGRSPIRIHAEALGIAAAQNEFAGRYYGQGTLIRDYVTVPPENKSKPDDVKAVVQEFHRGLENSHELAVLRGGEYKTVTLNAEDAQLLESRKWSVIEMAQILRIPPHKLYELSRATFSNIEHQSIEAVMDSVRPWVLRIEDQVNADPSLVTGQDFVEANLEGLLRGDIETRYNAYHQAIQDGWMTLDEPRRKENLPPMEGMAVAYRPQNMRLVDPETGEEHADRSEDVDRQKVLVEALGALVRAGFSPESSLEALGLDPIDHLGRLPVTVQATEGAGRTASPEDVADVLRLVSST